MATPELVWLGQGAWVACDPSLPEDDGRRVIAYLECKDGLVYVLWVRDRGAVIEFTSLREALEAVRRSTLQPA
jgi:hypothetical protein